MENKELVGVKKENTPMVRVGGVVKILLGLAMAAVGKHIADGQDGQPVLNNIAYISIFTSGPLFASGVFQTYFGTKHDLLPSEKPPSEK